MKNSLTALALLGATVFAAPAYAHEGWIQDFDEAVAIAKEQKKDLLVDFTGSDWCGWCIKLNEEVFDHDVFRESILKDYVLVSLDFPRSDEAKAKVPNPERNNELKDKYSISGFPTILLMDVTGAVYGQTGYQAGGPEAYLEHIAELRETGRKELVKVQAIIKGFDAATGDDKLVALGKVLDTLEGLAEGSSFANVLLEPARLAIKLDPKNEKGLKLRAVHGLVKALVNEPELLAAAIELDGTNTKGTYELAVWAKFRAVTDDVTAKTAVETLDLLNAHPVKDKEIGFSLNLTAARWSAGPLGNPAGAKAYATRAKGIGHENPEALAALEQYLGTEDAQ